MTDLFAKHKKVVADIKAITTVPPTTEEYVGTDVVHCHCNVEWTNSRGDFIGFDIEGADASYLYMYCGNFEENSFGSGRVMSINEIKEELIKFVNGVSS